MKCLLIYRFPHHHVMMDKMAALLTANGVITDIFCIKTYTFTNNSKTFWGAIAQKYLGKILSVRPYKLRVFMMMVFRKVVLKKMLSKYDKIDFHSYYIDLHDMMHYCISHQIPYDITLWGSDILRADTSLLAKMRFGFEHCAYIKGIDKLLEKVSLTYSCQYDEKLLPAYFGDAMCEVIDSITPQNVESLNKALFQKSKGKLIVTCGYNAMPAQQHKMMIRALNELETRYKKMIFLNFLMTYEKSDSYIKEIAKSLDQIGIDYQIMEHFLTEEELAVVRIKSDITINTQTTDALAAALVQHLYCGNVLIVGNWLEYKPFDERGIFYIKCAEDELTSKVSDVIDNYSEYKLLAKDNHSKLSDLASWDAVMQQWMKAFN